VTDGAAPPLPWVRAAGPVADRREGLACRPGPQASTLHSARHVKLARPGPQPRAGRRRCPPRSGDRTAPRQGWPPGGCREEGTVARSVKVCVTAAPAPATGQPGEGVPGCGQHVLLLEGSVMVWFVPRAAALFTCYRNPVLRALFHSRPRNGRCRGRATRLLQGSAEDVVSTAHLSVRVSVALLFVGPRAALPGPVRPLK
jgi:hypothetical protein